MMQHSRTFTDGDRYFFAMTTHQRQPLFERPEAVRALRQAFRATIDRRPFALDAICVLPDQLYCIWQLPRGDSDFPTRWRLIKTTLARHARFPGPIWQLQQWKHLIADEQEYRYYLDYLHAQPVAAGLATSPSGWAWSSFDQHVRRGHYNRNWQSENFSAGTKKGAEAPFFKRPRNP